jgi:hypothetical protein
MRFFWSWQSDTPGETGRYFVRDALLAAIKQLRQPEDVEEPTTAAHREAMELTSDRQGVTGSPPLAATRATRARPTCSTSPQSIVAARHRNPNARPARR